MRKCSSLLGVVPLHLHSMLHMRGQSVQRHIWWDQAEAGYHNGTRKMWWWRLLHAPWKRRLVVQKNHPSCAWRGWGPPATVLCTHVWRYMLLLLLL
jgi:hypothetical protein